MSVLRERPGKEVLSWAAGEVPFGESVTFDDLGHMDVLLSTRVFAAVNLALRN